MKQQARVERIADGGQAVISVRRKSACASDCGSCHGCAHPEETIEVTAYNAAQAAPGDRVTVESSSAQVLGLAGLLYILPVVLLVAGYFAMPGGEGVKILGGFLGLCLGLGVCMAVSRRMKRRGAMTFCITAIEEPGTRLH